MWWNDTKCHINSHNLSMPALQKHRSPQRVGAAGGSGNEQLHKLTTMVTKAFSSSPPAAWTDSPQMSRNATAHYSKCLKILLRSSLQNDPPGFASDGQITAQSLKEKGRKDIMRAKNQKNKEVQEL